MINLRDIDSVGDGPNANTSLALANGIITLNTSATTRLSVANTGQIVLGSPLSTNATVYAGVYVNTSSASPLRPVTTGSGTITLDFSLANNFTITLTAAATLSAPINATVGQSGVIFVVQPPAGTATLTCNTAWTWPNGAAPTTTAMANAVDSIVYLVRSGGVSPLIAAQFVSNYA